jgi:hypothetical protein
LVEGGDLELVGAGRGAHYCTPKERNGD